MKTSTSAQYVQKNSPFRIQIVEIPSDKGWYQKTYMLLNMEIPQDKTIKIMKSILGILEED